MRFRGISVCYFRMCELFSSFFYFYFMAIAPAPLLLSKRILALIACAASWPIAKSFIKALLTLCPAKTVYQTVFLRSVRDEVLNFLRDLNFVPFVFYNTNL